MEQGRVVKTEGPRKVGPISVRRDWVEHDGSTPTECHFAIPGIMEIENLEQKVPTVST